MSTGIVDRTKDDILCYLSSKESLTRKDKKMADVLSVAKITSKGQVTLPIEVRNLLGVSEGDRVLFVHMDDGSVSLRSSNLDVLLEAQKEFSGAAAEAGITSEADVSELVRSIRAERGEPSCA